MKYFKDDVLETGKRYVANRNKQKDVIHKQRRESNKFRARDIKNI